MAFKPRSKVKDTYCKWCKAKMIKLLTIYICRNLGCPGMKAMK